MQRALIVIGLFLLACGLAWPWLAKIPLGRLPGDINFVRPGASFHFPLMSCLVISILLSLLMWLLRR